MGMIRSCAVLTASAVSVLLAADATAGSASADGASIIAPLAAQSLLLDVARAGNRLVAVGERGHILYSDDEGRTWTQSDAVPSRTMLTAVTFANSNEGWAVGHDEIILRTQDGGKNWIAANYRPESQQPLLDVWFQDASHGLAVGAYGSVYETRDGGRAWTARKFTYQALPKPRGKSADDGDVPPDYHLNKLVAAGSRLFIAAEAGQLFRSDDGGANWRQLPSPYNGSFFGLLALSADQLLAFGLRGKLFRSNDGGQSWQPLASGATAMLTDGFQRADGTLVLVGLSGTVLTSKDQGASWTLHQQADRKGISAALPLSGDDMVVVGESGAHRITVAGK
jgi:photosystem II stability/assembly factor-like uncharacterized protein